MTDEPDDGSGDADARRPRGPREPEPSRNRSGLVAGEAAAIARFGEGPARFSAHIPAPRHPHIGPLLPRRRVGGDPAGHPAGHSAGAPSSAPAPSTALVRARRDLPVRHTVAPPSTWALAGSAARRGVEVVVDWTARGVVAAVDAVGAAAQAVVTLLFGPEQVPSAREQ
ncbi:hypothetical protein [Actinomycetospora sp.]|jgi:hypothetical protein|uniref:hypothetical protein n=1 Tax=Actinomycetospora sp. TaxID=1872135 RepID=UPI002F407824